MLRSTSASEVHGTSSAGGAPRSPRSCRPPLPLVALRYREDAFIDREDAFIDREDAFIDRKDAFIDRKDVFIDCATFL